MEKSFTKRRIQLNNGWTADWSNVNQPKYYLSVTNDKNFCVKVEYKENSLPLFGYFKDLETIEYFIEQYSCQLEWLFFEYVLVKNCFGTLDVEE